MCKLEPNLVNFILTDTGIYISITCNDTMEWLSLLQYQSKKYTSKRLTMIDKYYS